MSERLEREEQLPGPPSPVEVSSTMVDDIAAEQQLDPEIRDLVARCMSGVEDYGRELKPYEPQRFSPTNITTIFMLAAGFRGSEISRILGVTNMNVSLIKNHPYGQKLLHAMMHRQSARVLDIKTRLDSYAADMLDRLYQGAVHTEDLKLKTQITFGMLDRAGWGPTQKVESRSEIKETTVSDATIDRLSSALEESSRVNSAIMPHIKPSVPPAVGGEVIGASQQEPADAEGGSASSSQSSSPSPLKRLAEAAD